MSFARLPIQSQGVVLLQRSLERGRLAHAYLFAGQHLEDLEILARELAKLLNCQEPARQRGSAVDCCDQCANCRRIDADRHADVHWERPESRSRAILIEQVRELMAEIHLKPNEAEYKVAIIAGADRMNPQAANAFLKTLEEPPPKSVIILLTTEPQQLLGTVLSRCLRLNFVGDGSRRFSDEQVDWLNRFGEMVTSAEGSVLGRYRLLDGLQQQLAQVREQVESKLTAGSPVSQYTDVEPETRKRWEEELAAAIEAEYRRRRAEMLGLLQWWCRDVWLRTLNVDAALLAFPDMGPTCQLGQRLSSQGALANLTILEKTQRLLNTNVQEALTLEVGLLQMRL